MTNIEFAISLHEIADFYEMNQEMPQFPVCIYTSAKEEFLKAFQILRVGGKVEKDLGTKENTSQYQDIRIERSFSGLPVSVYTTKSNVCKRTIIWECPDSLLEEAMNATE